MRRRIDIHDLSDDTDSPYLYRTREFDSEENRQPVLYDEDLWQQLEAARAVVRTLEHKVHEALESEPFDEVEIELARLYREMLDPVWDEVERKYKDAAKKYNSENADALRERALAHAATRTKP